MLELQKSFPESRWWEQHCGLFYKKPLFYAVLDWLKGIEFPRPNLKILFDRSLIFIGPAGRSDISGIVKMTISGKIVGVKVGVEIKTGKAKQKAKQIAWQNMIESLGGIYILGRSTEQVVNELYEHKARLEK